MYTQHVIGYNSFNCYWIDSRSIIHNFDVPHILVKAVHILANGYDLTTGQYLFFL